MGCQGPMELIITEPLCSNDFFATGQNNQQQVIQPGTKKVFLSKDGKIIGAQLVHQPPTAPTNTGGKIAIPSVGGVQNPVATPTMVASAAPPTTAVTPQQQKVQIVRSSDGKIQVRGLLPGQQLVQMPDGKLQIFSQPTGTYVNDYHIFARKGPS